MQTQATAPAVCLSHGNKGDNTAGSLILMGYENTAKMRFRKSSNLKVVYLSKLGILKCIIAAMYFKSNIMRGILKVN